MIVRYTIEGMQEYAALKEGRCLSRDYTNRYTKLEWQCNKGHRWEMSLTIVRNGGWCPQCARNQRKVQALSDLRKIAEEKSGRLLSQAYDNEKEKLKWQCERGHVWHTSAKVVKMGSWCTVCYLEKNREQSHLTIEDMQQVAEERGGRCLSAVYRNYDTPLDWECEKSHRWSTSYNVIKQGSWCPACALQRMRKSIEDAQRIAALKGGKCLSKIYVNNHTHLKWRCKKGHVWRTVYSTVQQGHWCPMCAKKGPRRSLVF